ncbi:hypothetical protein GF386_03535 [Candidatus Pacearchaeota archaeon]|nr:hypothetical protein [Candidatus Pacearchaeota archaeon]MBD3283223.1 hypothetical protein [Candidatus Pacearchaeota archaeon]
MKINARVIPGSGRQEIVKINNDFYKIYLKKTPEDNKANFELLKLLKNYFKNSYDFENIKIIKGRFSRNKIVEIK